MLHGTAGYRIVVCEVLMLKWQGLKLTVFPMFANVWRLPRHREDRVIMKVRIAESSRPAFFVLPQLSLPVSADVRRSRSNRRQIRADFAGRRGCADRFR